MNTTHTSSASSASSASAVPVAASPNDDLLAAERLHDRAKALSDVELETYNVDLNYAVATMHRCEGPLATLRPALVRELVNPPLEAFDNLRTYLGAVAYSHRLCLASTPEDTSAESLRAEGLALRASLQLDVRALMQRKLLPASSLDGLKNSTSDRDLAGDLELLRTRLRDALPHLAGRTAVTTSELDHAWTVADRLYTLAGERDGEGHTLTRSERLALRDRYYTLFYRAYAEVRRAVQYLRFHEGDADTFVPSLWARPHGGRHAPAEAPAPAAPTTPAAPPAGGLLSLSNPASGLTVPPGEPFTR